MPIDISFISFDLSFDTIDTHRVWDKGCTDGVTGSPTAYTHLKLSKQKQGRSQHAIAQALDASPIVKSLSIKLFAAESLICTLTPNVLSKRSSTCPTFMLALILRSWFDDVLTSFEVFLFKAANVKSPSAILGPL